MIRRIQRLVPGLRMRLLLLAVLCAAPGCVLVSVASQREYRTAVSTARSNALYDARLLASQQENLIESARQTLTALAHVPAIANRDQAACNRILADTRPSFPAFTSFWVSGPDGVTICSSLTPTSRFDSSQRPWFRQVLASRAFTVGDYQIGGATGRPVIVLAYPLFGEDGAITSILGTALDLGWFSRAIATSPSLMDASVTIVDRTGTIIASHPNAEWWVGSSWLPTELGTFAGAHPQFDGTVEARGPDGVRRLYGITPFDLATGSTVAVGYPVAQVVSSANRAWVLEMTALGLALTLSISLMWLGSERLLIRRLRQVSTAADALRSGDLAVRVPRTGVEDELSALADTFNGMAQALEGRDAAIRERDAWARLLLASGRDTLLIYPTPVGSAYHRFIEVNDAGCARLGYTREEMLALTPNDIADRSMIKDWPAVSAQLAEHGHALFETVHLTKDGRRIPVEVNIERVDLHGRNISVAVCRDISARQEAEAALRDSEERFRTLVQNATDLLTIINTDGTIRYASPAAQRFLGYEPGTWIGRPMADLVHPDDRARALDKARAVREQAGTHPGIEVRIQHADGGWRDVEVVSNNQIDNPSMRGIIQTIHDVTERKRTEAVLRQREERFRALVQHSTDMISVVDGDGRFQYISPGVEFLLGYEAEDLIETSLLDLVHPDDREEAEAVFQLWLDAPGEAITAALRLHDHGGAWHLVESTGTNLLGEPSIAGIVFNTRDITERRYLEDQLKQEALNDALTGLPNRRLFVDRLTHALDGAGRRGVSVSVLFLDLDGFKRVNDTLGHAAGDALLVGVAGRLAACLRPMDTIARLGGDEFTVLLEDLGTPADVLSVADRLIAALSEPFLLDDAPASVGVSVGITFSGGRMPTPDDMLREADAALYQAKAAGKGRAVVFNAAMDAEARTRAQLELDLRRAIERQELVVHYQPEMDLASGAVCGFEALVRWQHPTLGLMQPKDFLAIAEGAGLMPAIGAWALRTACAQVRDWQAATGSDLVLGINLSSRQFRQPHLAEQIAATLTETGLAPGRLRLEITEATLMADPDAAVARCQELHALGVRLAIDNFGAGYSSLSYLRRLPLDTVKVSRAFVAELTEDQEIVAIVRAITSVAYDLGIAVTAEGLETRSQLASAVALNCQRGQGYLFAAPADAETIGRALRGERSSGQRAAGGVAPSVSFCFPGKRDTGGVRPG